MRVAADGSRPQKETRLPHDTHHHQIRRPQPRPAPCSTRSTHLGYDAADPHPGAGHPADHRRPRRRRLRPDRHRQDGGLRAAHPAAARRRAQGVRALVVTPTRELCAQIDEVARVCAKRSGQHVVAVYGGVPYEPQVQKVRRGVDLVIATPGRLLDMIQRGDLTLSKVEILVLDEADRMLDMGFWPDVQRIIRKLPERRQNLLFSATMSRGVLEAVRDTLRDPVRIQIGEVAMPVDEVEQAVYPVTADQKTELLVHFLRHHKPKRALIFTRTKHRADRLETHLTKHGIKGTIMHSNRTQSAAREGPRRLQERPLLRADRHRHRGPRHRRRRHLPRGQLRHPDEARRLRPPHRPHGARRRQRRGRHPAHRRRRPRAQGHRAPDRLPRSSAATCPGSSTTTATSPTPKTCPSGPARLLYRGGAQRAMQRGFRFSKPGSR